MIAIDTNVLVRLLVEDDTRQADRARKAIRICFQQEDRCLVTLIVLCELEWVLSSCYQVSREDIAASVNALLADPLFQLEEEGLVERAVLEFARGKADLSDVLLGARAAALGARTTLTFDKALREAEAFTLI